MNATHGVVLALRVVNDDGRYIFLRVDWPKEVRACLSE